MKPIKRTPLGYTPRLSPVFTTYDEEGGVYASTVHVEEYPTHSPVLGPDGENLAYEPRMTPGFDLRRKRD